MQVKVQILAILISLLMLSVVLLLVYKRRLREGYSLLWLLSALTLLAFSVFRGVLTPVANYLGISYTPSLLFAVSILFIFVIMLSQAVAITNLARRNRDLVQKVAILDWYVEQQRAETSAFNLNIRTTRELAQEESGLERDAEQL